MATAWYLECLDHAPPIQSDTVATSRYSNDLQAMDESEVHAAAAQARRRPYAESDRWSIGQSDYQRHLLDFCLDHPACTIGLVDENGEGRPIDDEQPWLQAQITNLEKQIMHLSEQHQSLLKYRRKVLDGDV